MHVDLGVNMSPIALWGVWWLLVSALWVNIVWYITLIPVVHEFVGAIRLLAGCMRLVLARFHLMAEIAGLVAA